MWEGHAGRPTAGWSAATGDSDREDSEGTEAWPRKEDKVQTKAGCWDEQDVGK